MYTSTVLAQTPEAPPNDTGDLKNSTVEAILEKFGLPDQKRVESKERESWYYGRSINIFSSGRVVGWSDAGELLERKNLAQVEKKPESEQPAGPVDAWENAWTPPKRPDSVDALKDFFPESK